MNDSIVPEHLEVQVPQPIGSLETVPDNMVLSSYSNIPSRSDYATASSLEVRNPAVRVAATQPVAPQSFSKRKAIIVSAIITGIVIMFTGASTLFLGKNVPKNPEQVALNVPVQDVGLEDTRNASLPLELQGVKEAFFVSTDIITSGSLKFSNNSFVTVIRPDTLTSNQIFTLPNSSGAICTDSNNCNYTSLDLFTQLTATVNTFSTQLGQIQVPSVPVSSIVNNQVGTVTVQGTTNQISVTTNNGVITVSTAQDIASTSSPTFSSLFLNGNFNVNGTINTSLNCTTFLNGGSLTTTASGQLICADDETSGGGTSVITVGGTVGTIPIFTAADQIADSLISQALGIVTINGGLTVAGAINGDSLMLTTALTVPNGGTGGTNFTANGLIIGNGAGAFTSTNAAANAQVLLGNGTTPTFTTLSGDVLISAGGVTSIQSDSITLGVDTTGDYLADVAVGNGLSVSGVTGEGATRTISLNIQTNKGLEVDANGLSLIDCGLNEVLKYNGSNQWACAADTDTDTTGSFTIAGSSGTPETVNNGDTVTIAAGNNISTTASSTDTITISTVNNPTFTTSVSTPLLQSSGALSITPNGALTVGATGQTALLQGSTTTITSTGAGNDIVLTPADQVRISTLNCTGFANGGVLTTDAAGNISCADDNGAVANTVTGTGTTNKLALFTGTNTVGDSWLLQNGSTLELDNTRNLSLMGGNFSVTGTGTFSGLITANGSLTIEAGDTFTFNGEAFTDLTGTGLQFNSGSLQTSLGTSVDLTSEVTGILPVSNGGTGVNGSTAANGTLLVGNGSGYSLATLSQGSGITITNGAGSITVASTLGTTIETGEITDLTVTGADIADDTIALGTKTTGNYVSTLSGSSQISVTGSGSESAAVTLGLVADSITDAELAYNTGQNLTTSSTPSFAGLNVTGGTLSIGTTSQLASLVLQDGNGQTTTLQPGNSTGNLSFTLPSADGSANQCIKTNASGVLQFGDCISSVGGGGGVTGSGTQNSIPKFGAGGTSIGDSTLSDDGTNLTTTVDLIVQGGAITVGTALQDAALTLYGNGFAATIDATLTASRSFSLPDGGGEFCIKELGNCSGAGGGNAPNSSQYLTLALDAGLSAERTLSFNGTNFSVVDNGANNSYTVNTAQNIDSTAAPSFAGLSLTGNLNMNANTIQGTTAVIDFTNFDAAANGNVTAGTYNGQTISSSASFTGTLGVTGLTTLNGGLTIEAGDTVTFNGDAFTDLTGNGLQVTSNVLTLLVQANKGLEVDANGLSLIDCSDGQLLKYNGSNQWVCAADGTGVDGDSVTVNGVAASDVNLLNTTASGSVAGTTFTLNNVSNPDDITLTVSVASDTVAGVTTTGAQTFAGVKTFNGRVVAADGIDLGTESLIGTTAAIDFTNFDVSSAGAVTAVGVNAGAGLIQGANGLTVSGTVTLSSLDCTGFANGGALTTNASGVISCSADDGGGAAPTLQVTYDNDTDGSNAVVTLTSADGAVMFRDNATPLSGTLFAVQNDNGSTSYLNVTATGVSVTGTGTFSGALAANGGINLAAQTLSGTTAVIDFTNFDVSSAGAVTAVGVNAGSGLIQGTGGITITGTTTLASLTNGFLEVNGSGVVSVGTIDLGTDTVGNYVATITSGNGISAAATGEGSTPTVALSNLTADWLQSGAFDVALDNSSSELKIRESAGSFYAIFDVSDLSADQTFTFSEGGTIITNTNIGSYATTAVTAGTGLTGGGTVGALTLNIGAGNGITANANDITLALQSNKGLEVDSNGLSLIDCADTQILKYNASNQWVCANDTDTDTDTDTGDEVSVNSTATSGANFLNTAASGTVASTTWSLNAASNPDDITLVIGTASDSEAGIVTTGAQTFAGAKTFNGSIIAGAGVNLGTQTLQGTTADIDFTNFDVTSAGALTAVGVNAGTGLLQGTGGLTVNGTITLSGLTNGFLEANGSGVVSVGTIDLGTDTAGNYVASISSGNGVSAAATGEGSTPTVALSNLTSDWLQSGAFDITLDNSSSELKIRESAGSFYAIFDVADLSADQTFTYNEGGAVVTSGNIASYGTTAVTAGSGLTGGGTVGALTLNIGAGNGVTVNANDITLAIQANKGLEVDANGLSLIDCASGEVLKYNGSNQWVCGTDIDTDTDTGDEISVNSTATSGANFLNTAASGTVASTTWSLNAATNPDDITLVVGTASNSEAGIVNTSAQTFAGAKTFNGQIIAGSGVNLGTQTLQGTTAAIDFTNFDVSSAGAVTAVGVNAGTGLIQGTGGVTVSGAVTLFSLANGFLEANGSGVVTVGTIDLGTDTAGNYVATISSGNGVSAAATGEGSTPTVALGNLTADWIQSGAFDISLANAGSELKIMESAGGTFYAILDTADLAADQTFTLSEGGTVMTSGNVATYATTAVTAGSGLTGGGTVGALTLNIGAGNGITVNANDITLAVQANKGLEVDSNGLSLIDCVSDGYVLKYSTGTGTWGCAADAGGAGVGDDVTVNSANAAGANFLDTSASGTVASTTWSLNAVSSPDDITLAIGTASATEAGIVNINAQTFAGAKTFNGSIIAGAGVNLGTQTLQGTTAAIDFTNFDVSSAGAVTAVGVNAGSGLLQGTGGLTISGTTTLSSLTNGFLEVNGSGTVSVGTIDLGTDTAGNYVATLTSGNGVSAAATGEGSTPTVALSNLTADWLQSGAFDITLDNSSSELKIRESAGSFYAIFDVSDLASDQTFTLSEGGTVMTSGNVATYATTGVSAGSGLTGGGTVGALTLNVASGNGGIVVNANDLTLTVQANKGLEVDANGLSLIDCGNTQILKYSTGTNQWGCAADNDTDTGDEVSVNSTATSGANFLNTAASGTVASTTWGLNAVSNPDDITLIVGTASNTEAGIVNTSAQVFAGAKTFNGQIIAGAGVNLGTQTLQGTTAAIDFTNFDVSSAGAVTAVGVNAGSGLLQGTGGLTITGTTTLSSLANGFLEANGSGVVSVGTIDLGTDTAGNYVASISSGNGVSAAATGEGSTPTVALSNLTADWIQSGAFDISLANAGSELKIMESVGATFYAILDVSDLAADQTFTLSQGGTVMTSGNVATYATTGVTAGTGLTGGGTVGAYTVNVVSGNGGIVANANDLTLTVQANKGLEVDANGLSLIDCGNTQILKYSTGTNQWGCAADVDTDTGDEVSVNSTATAGANFLNTVASGTVASTTWSLNAVSSPDDITLAIGTASATEAGIVNINAQTFAGAKTFNGQIIAGAGVNLGTQTMQGTTAAIDFTNFDVSSAGAITAVGVNAGTGLIQGTGGLSASGTITLSSLANGFLEANGSGVVSVGTIDLGTDTTGNYVATITSGNGVSGAATGEGSTPTLALSNLTADWIQSGAFDISLANAGSELKIMESTGATFYAILDVSDLSADQTFTLSQGGTVMTSGNVATYATTGVTAGTGLTGGGTVGAYTVNVVSGNGGIVANANDLTLTVQANKGLEVDANGLSLIDCADTQILKYSTGTNQWGCAADAGGSGLGDNTSVNGTAAADANFLNTVASGTSTAVSWTLTAASTPDDVTLSIGNASATEAGAVTTGAQTFAGAKTFNAQIVAGAGVALGTQTLQGTTAAIDFTNFDVSSSGDISASGTAVIQGASVTVGAAATQGSFILNDGSTNTGTIRTAALGSNRTYILPDAGTNAVICLDTGNCAGTGTGVTTAGGTTNRLAKFSGSQAIADSSISDDGTNVTVLGTTDLIVQGGNLTIGTTSGQGTLLLHDGNGQTTSIVAGNSVGNLAFVLPTDLGASNQCLKNSGTAGTLTFANCNTGSGSGGAVTLQDAYDDSGTPASILLASGKNLVVTSPEAATDPSILFNLQCATCSASGGRFAVQDNGSDIFTVNPDGSIVMAGTQFQVTSAGNVTASGTALFQGASVTVGAAATQGSFILNDGSSNTGIIQTAALGSNRTYILPDAGTSAVICLDTGNCAGSGAGITGSGAAGQVAFFDATDNITSDGDLLFDGTNFDVGGTLFAGTTNAFQVSAAGAVTAVGVNAGSGSLQGSGGATISGNTTIATTAGNTLGLGNSTGAVTVTGSASSTFVINGITVSAGEFNLLDNRDTALVDTTDSVNTAITGTGILGAGSIASGFGSIDTGADNITTTGTVQGTTSVLTTNIEAVVAGALGIGNLGTATSVSICNSANCDTISLGTNADADSILLGDALDTITVTGSSSSTFVLNGVTVSAAEFNVLDGGIAAGELTTQGTATDEYCLTYETGGGALLAWQACGGGGGGISAVGTFSTSNTAAGGATISGSDIIFQSASASAPGMVDTGAQTFAGAKTFNSSVTLAANQTLNLTGGTTASRPGSPTEGMLYYDTDTDQLLVYSAAQTKWMADSRDAYLVAANNSSAADKAAADYIADGTGDQTEINAALTRADPASVTAGARRSGKVYLFAGTYVANGTILIPNNTTLAGSGRGTLIELADLDASDNLIEDTGANKTGVTIQDLRLDGRNDLNTAGTQNGILLSSMGAGTGSAARQGAKLTNLWLNNFRDSGVFLNSSLNNSLAGITAQGNSAYGIRLDSSSNNILSGNLAQGNGVGFNMASSSNNTLTGNTAEGNTTVGFSMASSSNNTLTGNTSLGNATYGIQLLLSTNNAITGNKIHDNGGATTNDGIYIFSADTNTITNNNITDTSATTTNYPININNATSDNNYLADNTLGGGSINDASGGDTIYGGQMSGSGSYVIEADAGSIELQSNTNIIGNLDTSGTLTVGSANQLTIDASGNLDTSGTLTVGSANQLTIDASGNLTTSGTVGISNTSATAFTIQSASAADTLFTANTTSNRIVIGNATGTGAATTLLVVDSATSGTPTGIAGAMYYDATNNKFKCYTTSWVDCDTTGGGGGGSRKVSIIPEYAGGVISADGSNNNGTLTSNYDSVNRHNYYEWTSSQVALNDYDIIARSQIPSDYASGFGTFKIWVYGDSNSTANNDMLVTVRDGSGTACATSVSVLPGTAATWTEQTVTLSGCTFAANDIITIQVQVQSKSSNKIRAGEISFMYTD